MPPVAASSASHKTAAPLVDVALGLTQTATRSPTVAAPQISEAEHTKAEINTLLTLALSASFVKK